LEEAFKATPAGLVLTPDGKTLAVGSDNGIKLYDVSSGAARSIAQQTVGPVDLVFSPDGTQLGGS
jgi:hypothetical protein